MPQSSGSVKLGLWGTLVFMAALSDIMAEKAMRGTLDEEAFEWLLPSLNEDKRCMLIAACPNLPKDLMVSVAHTGTLDERKALVRRKKLPSAIKTILRKDRSVVVARAAGATIKPKVKSPLPAKAPIKAKKVVDPVVALSRLDYKDWSNVLKALNSPHFDDLLDARGYPLLSGIWKNHPTKRKFLGKKFRDIIDRGSWSTEEEIEFLYELIVLELRSQSKVSTSYYMHAYFGETVRAFGLLPVFLPTKWLSYLKSSGRDSVEPRYLIASHPDAPEKLLLDLLKEDEDDHLFWCNIAKNPAATDKVIVAWSDRLYWVPVAYELPDRVSKEAIEELHQLKVPGAYRLLGALGKLTEEEVSSIIANSSSYADDDLASDILSLPGTTRSQLLAAATSKDPELASWAARQKLADNDIRIAYGNTYPEDINWFIASSIPASRRDQLPMSTVMRLSGDHGGMRPYSGLDRFEKDLGKLVSKYGSSALRLLDAASSSPMPARDVLAAIYDTLR